MGAACPIAADDSSVYFHLVGSDFREVMSTAKLSGSPRQIWREIERRTSCPIGPCRQNLGWKESYREVMLGPEDGKGQKSPKF